MRRNSKISVLISTAFLSWVGGTGMASAEVLQKSPSGFFKQDSQGKIEEEMQQGEVGVMQQGNDLLGFLDKLKASSDKKFQKAAEDALSSYNAARFPRAKIQAAVKKFNEEVGATENLLPEGEKKVLMEPGSSVGSSLKGDGESGDPKELTADRLIALFKGEFAGIQDDNERVTALEQLINKLIVIGGGQQLPKNETAELLKFLYNTQTDAGIDKRIKLFCQYFLQEMENSSLFANAMVIYNNWLNDAERNNHLILCGKAWNKVKASGDIKKFSYSSTKDYVKDATAIPLINLLTKSLVPLFMKTDPRELTKWSELIPFTPHDVILAIYYNILRYDLDDEEKVEQKFAGGGSVKNKHHIISAFIRNIRTAALNDRFGQERFDAKSQRLQDALDSIVGGPGRVSVWNSIEPNALPDFSEQSMRQALQAAKPVNRAFKFVRENITTYIPDYVIPVRKAAEAPVVKGMTKLTPEFENKIKEELKAVLGGEPRFPNTIAAQIFYKKVRSAVTDENGVKAYLEGLHKEGELDVYK